MASRQNLNNRSNAFKPTGKRGILGKVYGALGKEFKQRRAQPTVTEQQPEELTGQRRETGGFRGITMGERDPTGGGPRIAPDFRDNLRRSQEQQRRTAAPPAPTQPPIQTTPGYEQRDEPVFDQSALATEEQIPGQSTPLPPPSTHSNISNRLARNRVTANQPTEDIPPDSPSPRSRGMGRRR